MNIVKSEAMLIVPEHPNAESMLKKLADAKATPGAIIRLNKEESDCLDKCVFVELDKTVMPGDFDIHSTMDFGVACMDKNKKVQVSKKPCKHEWMVDPKAAFEEVCVLCGERRDLKKGGIC